MKRFCTIDYFQVIKKSQMSKYTCQLIFLFLFKRRPRNFTFIRQGPRDKRKKGEWKV